MDQANVRQLVQQIVAGACGEEAKALVGALHRWTERGVVSVWRRSYASMFSASEVEEICAAARCDLWACLHGFRGEERRSLRAYAIRVGGRTLSRSARRRFASDRALALIAAVPGHGVCAPERDPVRGRWELALRASDRALIRRLLDAPSQGQLARQLGISPGRLSQRKRGLFERIRALPPEERDRVARWLAAGAPG